MNINFKMWRTAAWQLVKMEDKKKWDALDVVSKWLIATRSGVTTVTIYSCIIGGLLAWRDKSFAWLPWLIVTIGLFMAASRLPLVMWPALLGAYVVTLLVFWLLPATMRSAEQ